MSKVMNITFAGIGGQGVLTATDVLAAALFNAGFDVKKSEVHGMSQRGGSVSSEVRYGEKVASPMIPNGESDFLVVIDETQVDVNIHKLAPNGVLITPSMVDANKLANKRSINIALMGLLSTYLDLPLELWENAIKSEMAEKIHAVNIDAFALGRESR